MITETHIMEDYKTTDGELGHITLNKLAIPETISVMLDNQEIMPIDFDVYGHPFFAAEQLDNYLFKTEKYHKLLGDTSEPLVLQVSYVEREFDIKKESFDSIEGIKKALTNLDDLNEVVKRRMIYHFLHPEEKLNEFVLFGLFLLNSYGGIFSVDPASHYQKLNTSHNIETFSDFYNNNHKSLIFTSYGGFVIPRPKQSCSCCGKKITFEDTYQNPCIKVKYKYFHKECYDLYVYQKEIYKLGITLMQKIYDSSMYSYESIEKTVVIDEKLKYLPWIKVTVNNEETIIIGSLSNKYSIEWQDEYKINFSKLFKNEKANTWSENNKFGIYASNLDEAENYLKRVADEVKLKKSKSLKIPLLKQIFK